MIMGKWPLGSCCQAPFNSRPLSKYNANDRVRVGDIDLAIPVNINVKTKLSRQDGTDDDINIGDVDFTIAIHVTNLGRRDFNPA